MYFRVMKVLHFPLIKITIGLVLGLSLSHYIHLPIIMVFVSLLILLSTLIAIHYFTRKNTVNDVIFGINAILLAGVLGISTQIIHSDTYRKSHYLQINNIFDDEKTFIIVIREKLKKTSFSDRYIAEVLNIDNHSASGKIILNVTTDRLKTPLRVGAIMQLKSTLFSHTGPKNPYQFNYDKYLQNKTIYGQLYTYNTTIKIAKNPLKDIWYYSDALRNRILHNLQKNDFNSEELNVAMALILGQQQDISPDIVKSYQYAGAVHILSVSGLHIGFILMFMTLVLKPIPNTKKGSFIKLFLILCSLLLFGILAGLAPSVVRSMTMFSFIAVGNHLRTSVNIYHTLVVSILVILLFEPSFLFDVGFQLSYLALFFILWLQPMLQKLYEPKTKVALYFWSILTVSFAAQLGTLPLSIYYFHQFPGLFFVTNLIVIPFLSVIMILGVVVMVWGAVNTVPLFVSELFEWSIYILNKIIHFIATFEYFVVKDIPLHYLMLLSSYLSIICIIAWFKKPTFHKLIAALASLITIQGVCIYNRLNSAQTNELIVFNIPKQTIITVKQGDECTIFYNNSDSNEKIKTIVGTYLMSANTSITKKRKGINFIYFKGKKIFILDSTVNHIPQIKPDILILTQSVKMNVDRVLLHLKPKVVIADGSNFKTIQQLWKKSCQKQKIPFHMTREKGYYSIK